MRRDKRLMGRAVSALLLALIASGLLAGAGSGIYSASAEARLKADTSQNNESVILRVYFNSKAERDRLAEELGAIEVATTGGFITIWTDWPSYDRLRAERPELRVEIDEAGTKSANTPIEWRKDNPSAPTDPTTFYGGYRTVTETVEFMDAKVAANPNLAEKVDIGDSWCKAHPGMCIFPPATTSYTGTDLLVLRITNRSIPGPKPAFWYDAGIHSREIATPEVAMRFISSLLDEYNTNADARWLVDYHDIWVMPMQNPDGHYVVERGGNNPQTQRKNLNLTACITYPPTGGSQRGIDLNRNYPFKWNLPGCSGCSSSSGCSLTYRGSSAASEDETQAMVAKLREIFPDQRGPNDNDPAPITTTGVMQSMHSVANLNLFPWGAPVAIQPNAPNDPDLRNIGAHMSALNANGTNLNAGGNGYEYGRPDEVLYGVDGDSTTFGYGDLGIPSYTTELSGGSFYPTYTCIDNPGCGSARGIWPENRAMLTYMAKIARTPYLTTRGPDTNVPTLNPMTVTVGAPTVLTATINHNWTGNTYAQNIAAAEYYIDTPPWAGGVAIPMAAGDGAFDARTEAVQATVNTAGLTPGRHIIFVRGRGVTDYEGFQSWGAVSAVFLDVTPGGGGTPTATSVVPTVQATATRTATTIVPTVTSTSVLPTLTSVLPTVTSVPPSVTAAPSNTPGGPTSTATVALPTITVGQATATAGEITATATGTSMPVATGTPGQATSTPGRGGTPTTTPGCTSQFTDVPTSNDFYANIRCLACRGILGGYSDGTFRPNNNITRGQIAKIVSNSAGFNEAPGADIYEDVPATETFFPFIQRLSRRGFMGGYPCGGVGEPCSGINKPYFRPNNPATRGQIAKIVSNSAGFNEPVIGQRFTDVPPSSTFYPFIERLATRGVMGGYSDGTFRPNNDATRGQTSKIVANTFFPNCQTP